MKNLILLFLAIIAWSAAWSQDNNESSNNDNGPIFTDRPSQTDAVSLLPKGVFQIETGYFWSSDKTQTSVGSTTVNFMDLPNLVFKYGIAKWLELRAGTRIQYLRENSSTIKNTDTNIGPVFFAPKIKLLEPKGFIPRTSLAANLTIPGTGAGAFKSNDGALSVRLLMENVIADNLVLTYSIGTDSNFAPGGTTDGFYTVMLSTSFGNIGAFAEFFSSFNPNRQNTASIDGGLNYLITENISIDAAIGLGLNSIATDVFINAGIGFRLPGH